MFGFRAKNWSRAFRRDSGNRVSGNSVEHPDLAHHFDSVEVAMKRSPLSMFAIFIFTASALHADIGPGPSPEPRDPSHVSLSELEARRPVKTDSTIQADIAPTPPVLEATSPVPMVIGGLAATAGVALLGLWIAKRGRSGDA